MSVLKLLACGLLSLLFLSGCATIDATTTSSYAPDYRSSGTIAVIASVAEVNASPEFSRYKPRIENKLAANGYTIVSKPSEATYLALVAYGMDLGLSGVVSTPLFGQAGGGAAASSPSGSGNYAMPSYGTVGSSSQAMASYNRAIALDIVEAASMKEGKPGKVFEIRTRSTGSSRSIGCVFDEMLEAMFMDFPGTSGKAKSVTLPYNGDC